MDRKSKVLFWCIAGLLLLSISATFYKTVVLEDFVIEGMGVYAEQDYTYSWFTYAGEEYEIEIESNDFDEFIQVVSEETGVNIQDEDSEFTTLLEESFTTAIDQIEHNDE